MQKTGLTSILLMMISWNTFSQSIPDMHGLSHSVISTGQDSSKPDRGRIWLVGGSQAALWAGSFYALNKAWYSGYAKEKFHLFNDWGEWQQMDKAGHVWTAYQVSRLSAGMWRWTGIDPKQAAWLGGASSIAYLSIIEILDGYSDKWGFSMGDMAMNISGAALFTAQQLVWNDQRIQVKFSYIPYSYGPDVHQRSDELFGKTGIERILKDYNSQTYWMSINIHSFFPRSGIPSWLNLSLGMGARTMLGGEENKWTDENGNILDRSDIPRYRRFFLSADVDLTKIRTRSAFLKSVFSVINMVKVPAPAIEWNTRNQFKGHWIYF